VTVSGNAVRGCLTGRVRPAIQRRTAGWPPCFGSPSSGKVGGFDCSRLWTASGGWGTRPSKVAFWCVLPTDRLKSMIPVLLANRLRLAPWQHPRAALKTRTWPGW